MTVESATYINGLNAANPGSTDLKAEGDDHIRLLKSTVKATFPNLAGAVTPTHTELNYVDGVTSAIQTQIDGKVSAASPAFSGAVTVVGTAVVTTGGTTYQSGVQLESGANLTGEYTPAVTFSASGVKAAIYATRLSAFGGSLVLATQSTAGGNPASRLVIDSTGLVTASVGFTGPFAGTGACTVNGGKIVTDGGGATFTTSLPVGTVVFGGYTGAAVAPGATAAFDGSTYVRVYGTDGSTNSLLQYGTWRLLGFVSGSGSLWVRNS